MEGKLENELFIWNEKNSQLSVEFKRFLLLIN